MSSKKLTVDAELELLQYKAFSYFLHETNPVNGLVIDKTAAHWPASIAATGLALAAYPVAVERGLMARAAAVERTLTTLRFFWHSPHGPEPNTTGHQGFYYHFLDMQTGRRAWHCELSTIDSAFLLAGALTAGVYFDADTATSMTSASSPLRSFGARSETEPVWRISLFTNINLVVVVAISFGLQVWSQHNATLGRFLKTSSLPLADCFLLLALGAIPLLTLEMVKMVRRARRPRKTEPDEYAKPA